MNIFIKLICTTLCLSSTLHALVNDSITPLLDYYRTPKQVEAKKYSKTQYEAILEAFKQKDSSFRVVSYNMLFDRYDHLLAKPYRWNARLPRVLDLIDEMHADLVCMQELYPNQVQDILKDIGHEYGFAGKLPEPGQEPTEINGILYRKTRFSCESCKVYYISETPDTLSSDPFSKERRTLVEAHLTDIKTKKEIAVFCTQIAFGSADSREYAANYIIKHIEPICQKKACILAGDFNCFSPHLDDPHVPFCDGTFIMRLLTSKSLQNSRDVALIGTIGPLSTYTNLPGAILPFQGRGTPGIILDHILVTTNVQILISAIQPGQVDGLYGSDHLPVIADCIVK